MRLNINPLKLKIRKGQHSTFILDGVLNVSPFRHGHEPVRITLDAGATLEVCGDFTIGNGTEIYLWDDSYLRIGGNDLESGSGITERTRIMVYKRITIGKDFLCAWGVFITDCDWHLVETKLPQDDVTIGDHVWIALNCSILKGTQIGSGSIVSTGTVISKKRFPDSCIIGGNPAMVLDSVVGWRRDLPPVTMQKKCCPD